MCSSSLISGIHRCIVQMILVVLIAACADSDSASKDTTGAADNGESPQRVQQTDATESRRLEDLDQPGSDSGGGHTADTSKPGAEPDDSREEDGRRSEQSGAPAGSEDRSGTEGEPFHDLEENQALPARPAFADAVPPTVAVKTVLTLDAPIDMAVAPGDDHAWIG